MMIGGAMGLAAVMTILLSRTGTFDSTLHGNRSQHAQRYATAAGRRAVLTLEDGTIVTLAPQTTLHVSPGFGGTTRDVTLSGEAYFSVTRHGGAPFIVHTGNVTTRVLGTTFDVRHHAADSAVRIAVIDGKVEVLGHRGPVVLSKAMVATVTDSTTYTESTTDLHPYTEWTNGKLVFKNVPVSTMLAALGRWYGYQFRLADSVLASERVTARFRVDEQRETLIALERLLDVTMVFDDSVVTIQPRKSESAPPRGAAHESFSTPTGIGK